MFKLITYLVIVTIIRGSELSEVVPITVAEPVLTKNIEENDPHPQYNFSYDIQDSISGDSKSQVESRNGDLVQGQYSLIDADGYKRIVDYSADSINGFNAVVRREPVVVATDPAVKVVTNLTPSSPAIVKSFNSIEPARVKSEPVKIEPIPRNIIKNIPTTQNILREATPLTVSTLPIAQNIVRTATHSSLEPFQAAQTILRTSVPFTISSPSLLHTIRTSKIDLPTYQYTSPVLIQNPVPITFSDPSTLIKTTLASNSNLIKLTPNLIESYKSLTPAATYVKSSSYTSGNALSLAASHAAVKTKFGSPIISYTY